MGINSSPIAAHKRYQRIKQLLLQELTHAQISDRLGISRATVSRASCANFQIGTRLHTQFLLTDIEIETIFLVSKGYSNYAIAILQKSAYRSVDSRLKRVYRKLNITNKKDICKRVTAANMLAEFLIDR